MSITDRKIINIFKSFIERIFVPHLSKMDLESQKQWTNFSNMISVDQVNLNQLQLYVDTLPTINASISSTNKINTFQALNTRTTFQRESKSPFLSKVRKESANQLPTNGFSLTRTFGGDKARNMFPLKDFDESQSGQAQNGQGQGDRQNYNFSKDFSKEEGQSGFTTQQVVPSLERLFKIFNENQSRIEKVGLGQGSYEGKSFVN